MSESSEILVIPGKIFGDFYLCPIKKTESRHPEPVESLLSAEFEKMLSPDEGRKTIARIHANNIIQRARLVIDDSKIYIHSCREGNYVFFLLGFLKKESDGQTLVQDIEKRPAMFLSNDIFKEKISNYRIEQNK